jgi:hypothetical protein
MAKTSAEYLYGRLIESGSKPVYGYPEDGINGIVARPAPTD